MQRTSSLPQSLTQLHTKHTLWQGTFTRIHTNDHFFQPFFPIETLFLPRPAQRKGAHLSGNAGGGRIFFAVYSCFLFKRKNRGKTQGHKHSSESHLRSSELPHTLQSGLDASRRAAVSSTTTTTTKKKRFHVSGWPGRSSPSSAKQKARFLPAWTAVESSK